MGDVKSPLARAQQELVRGPVRQGVADRSHHVGSPMRATAKLSPRGARKPVDALESAAREGTLASRIATFIFLQTRGLR